MPVDLLRDAEWELCSAPAGSVDHPKALADDLTWIPAVVPGTAAAALRAAGDPSWQSRDYDSTDWWFRTSIELPGVELPVAAATHELTIGGIATVSDVWVNGEHVFTGRSMFTGARVALQDLPRHNEIVIRCSALAPILTQRMPRGRWRTSLVRTPNLRHVRTTMFGRMPGWAGHCAPVGPCRPVTLTDGRGGATVGVTLEHLSTQVSGTSGVVRVRLRADTDPGAGDLVVGALRQPVTFTIAAKPIADGEPGATEWVAAEWVAEAELEVPDVELWWPHTHGGQPRYELRLERSGTSQELGTVAFRTVEVDDADGRFALRINGVEIFCRGAVWMPLDPIAVAVEPGRTRAAVGEARTAHMNMLRVAGTAWYEGAEFFDACDELGVLVWQDCMLANLDPSAEPEVLEDLCRELEQFADLAQGRPSVVVVSGGSEVEQQAAMSGVDRSRWHSGVLDSVIPEIVRRRLPGVVSVSSSPTGGPLPFVNDVGIAHYFGVGAYRRPLEDARRSEVRFAAECLAFAIPPEQRTVDEVFGGAAAAGHHPAWKAAVPRDAGAPWDFDDVREHYVQTLFGVDPAALRSRDPARALDLGRAAIVECMTSTFSEWRRAGSPTAGGLVLSLRDLVPGAGWGLIDALGRRKSAWYALRRTFAPVAVLATDEGLNGLRLHVVNDGADELVADLRVRLFVGEHAVEEAAAPVRVPGHGATTVDTAGLFAGFRDLTDAYGFGPNQYSAVLAELIDPTNSVVADLVWLPGPRDVFPDTDLGLTATLHGSPDQRWLACSARRTARWVSLQVDGAVPADSWFHLAPGVERIVPLELHDDAAITGTITGTITALNGLGPVRIEAGVSA